MTRDTVLTLSEVKNICECIDITAEYDSLSNEIIYSDNRGDRFSSYPNPSLGDLVSLIHEYGFNDGMFEIRNQL